MNKLRWKWFMVAVFIVIGPSPHTPEYSYAQGKENFPHVYCGTFPDLNPECVPEFEEWLKAAEKWKEYKELNGNFAGFNRWGGISKGPGRPAPPVWLGMYCEPVKYRTDAGSVCQPYFMHEDFDWIATAVDSPGRKGVYAIRVPSGGSVEQENMIDFLLRNTHLNGLWINSSSGKRSIGYFGVHLTMANFGRFHVWGPPGVILMRGPDGQLKVRRAWGVDFHLNSPKIPGTDHKIRLYVSIARLLVGSGSLSRTLYSMGDSVVGLSITWK